MIKSVVFKTSLAIAISVFIIISFLAIYLNTTEKYIIEKIQDEHKQYIISRLNQTKKESIKKELEILNTLLLSVEGGLSDALYNLDERSIKAIFQNILLKENIKAIYVYDNLSKKIFLVGYKNKNKIVYSYEIPPYIKKLPHLKNKTLIIDHDNIGYVNIYYDNSTISKRIESIKQSDLSTLHNNIDKIDEIVSQTILFQIIFFIIATILMIFITVYLMKKFVQKPLYMLKDGLEQFFTFFSNPTETIKPIKIKTQDEFGQMAQFLNNSIKASVDIHKQLQERNELTAKLNRELEENEYELELVNESLELKVQNRTKDLEAIHKHTRESIEYASLIQGALIPQKGAMELFFKDHFVTWIPKDTVGGDIWLFNKLRHDDECLLFFIDCTGHGVPGAFVTMIVKAVEREIVSKIIKKPELDISPAIIMGYFNKTMKTLLRQETKDSLSNAGWDGGIIYYNRRTQILKFAGAETPLFYTMPDGEFKTVKGNRYSVGYKKCDANYEYKETTIEVEEGMKFYCTTDGYLDQNGGEKDFPFGKKRFGNIVKEHHEKPMEEQQTIFLNKMEEYETMIPDNDRNDDMTVIAFEIGTQSNFVEEIVEEIVKYEGVMTQNVIASCMDNIEVKITNMGMMGTVSTITIEYCQNMMNYSKNEDIGSRQIVPAGTIEVQYINKEYYDIMATNIVSIEDKEKIEPKLIEIQGLDKAGIKKRYRELRKSGQNTHEKGGGIGMYEIAKVSDSIEYNFEAINEDKYIFTMKSFVKPKAKREK